MRGPRALVFAVEATPDSGAGHLRRCIRFAQGFNPETEKFHVGKVEIDWLVSSQQKTFSVLGESSQMLTDPIVILDSYDLEFCRQIQKRFPKETIIQIADRFTPVLDDVFVLWLDFSDGEQFENCQNQIIGAGFEYMPIIRIDRRDKGFLGVARKVLITTGGNPFLRINEEFCSVLSKSQFKGIGFHFIGEQPSALETQGNFIFHPPGVALDKIAEEADTIITGCGTSLWDFLANNFCVGAMKLVENQDRNYKYVEYSRQAIPLRLNEYELEESLEELILSSETRRGLVDASTGFFDFEGSRRFAQLVESL